MSSISFGERIKRARIRNAMTQWELAEKMNLTQPAISHWETGKSTPDRLQKEQLQDILGLGESDTGSEIEAEVDTGPNPLSGWLTKSRLERGLSVSELARAAGLSTPAIYNIESGRIANPHAETIRRLEYALQQELPSDAKEEIREEAEIEGIGELIGFDPHDDDDLPSVSGVYVLYDISQRPIYIGESNDIKRRIRSHRDRFWFKQPIVEVGAYVEIRDKNYRESVEKLLIRFLKSNAVINQQHVDRD